MKKPARHTISEGQRMDLHAGAAGKVILAYSSEEMVATVLAKTGLPKRTAATITGKNGRSLSTSVNGSCRSCATGWGS
ncbi:MAG: hypothetical protein HY895_15400 [Deltaproteobacteria bacterium]|nr:hypothetical protein [Deltaproteobacteria bacterium]